MRSLAYYAGVFTVWVLFCTIGVAVTHLTLHPRASHEGQCVVCKPSGKLAMWGECE